MMPAGSAAPARVDGASGPNRSPKPPRAVSLMAESARRNGRPQGLETDAAERLGAVAKLGRLAMESPEVERLLDEAVTILVDTLGVDYSSVLELLPSREEFVFRAGTGWGEGLVGSLRVPVQDRFIAGHTLLSGEPLVVEDLRREPHFIVHPVLAAHGVRSTMSVIMHGEIVPFGVLSVCSKVERTFAPEDVAFLQAIADLLALGIQRKKSEVELRRNIDVLRETDAERRRLVSRLVHAQEEERLRIAGDIHDDSIQVMTALGIRLHRLRRLLADPGQEASIVELEQSVSQTIDRLRHLMFQLRPASLDRQGLVASLREYVEQMRDGSGVVYRIESSLETALPEACRTISYRIAQEALNNIRKHALPKHVKVLVRERAGGVLVHIEDDGLGFPPDRALRDEPGHLGLTSMRERAEMSGGWCRVASLPQTGTTVEFWIPFDGGADEATHPEDAP